MLAARRLLDLGAAVIGMNCQAGIEAAVEFAARMERGLACPLLIKPNTRGLVAGRTTPRLRLPRRCPDSSITACVSWAVVAERRNYTWRRSRTRVLASIANRFHPCKEYRLNGRDQDETTQTHAVTSSNPAIACANTALDSAADIFHCRSRTRQPGMNTTRSAGILAHGQTVIYVEKGQWYLLVMTRCGYLTADNRCGIYLNRPKICREYTTENCEYDSAWSFEKIFETPEQIWEYAEAVLPPRREESAILLRMMLPHRDH